jgi:hypothetical protein
MPDIAKALRQAARASARPENVNAAQHVIGASSGQLARVPTSFVICPALQGGLFSL